METSAVEKQRLWWTTDGEGGLVGWLVGWRQDADRADLVPPCVLRKPDRQMLFGSANLCYFSFPQGKKKKLGRGKDDRMPARRVRGDTAMTARPGIGRLWPGRRRKWVARSAPASAYGRVDMMEIDIGPPRGRWLTYQLPSRRVHAHEITV